MTTVEDLQKLFLQAMMSRAMVKKNAAGQIIKHCAQMIGYALREVTPDDVSEILVEINAKISKFGMELKEVRAEYNMEEFVVLINDVDCSNMTDKLNHVYSLKEREFFRRVLEAMVTSEELYGTVSAIECLNMPNTGMRPGEIEELMKRFSSDCWFLHTDERRICPSPRCIAEFEVYFKQNFPDHIALCPLCHNVVFFGTQCGPCEAISHKYCIVKFNKSRKTAPKCSCGAPFTDSDQVEEQNGNHNGDTPQSTKKSRTGRNFNQTQDTIENTPGPSRSRKSKRSHE